MVIGKNSKIMGNFTLKNIPDLDTCVLGALELLEKEKLPTIKIPYKRPLVVGSGNAEVTGKIIFKDKDAIFASESDFESKLKNTKKIDGVVLISASGGKHAPIIAKISKKYKKHITLLTNNASAKAEKETDHKHKHDVFLFPKQREPYTYNTSTYLGMVLGKTKESPKDILAFIKKLKLPKNIAKYDSYYIIVPEKFDLIRELFHTKFDELFGPKLKGETFTFEQTKHAKTVIPSEKELFISIGKENKKFGEKRLYVPLPKNANSGMAMAVGYYIIGKIQKGKPPYFKRNLAKYMKKASKLFGTKINPIVE